MGAARLGFAKSSTCMLNLAKPRVKGGGAGRDGGCKRKGSVLPNQAPVCSIWPLTSLVLVLVVVVVIVDRSGGCSDGERSSQWMVVVGHGVVVVVVVKVDVVVVVKVDVVMVGGGVVDGRRGWSWVVIIDCGGWW